MTKSNNRTKESTTLIVTKHNYNINDKRANKLIKTTTFSLTKITAVTKMKIFTMTMTKKLL